MNYHVEDWLAKMWLLHDANILVNKIERCHPVWLGAIRQILVPQALVEAHHTRLLLAGLCHLGHHRPVTSHRVGIQSLH
jgi:hypothetical protein